MNWFWWKFTWMLALWRRKFFIWWNVISRGQWGIQKVTFLFKIHFFLFFFYDTLSKLYTNANIIKTQLFFIEGIMTSKDIKGYFYAKIFLAHIFMNWFRWMLTSWTCKFFIQRMIWAISREIRPLAAL